MKLHLSARPRWAGYPLLLAFAILFACGTGNALAAAPAYNLTGKFISGPLSGGVRDPQNGTAYVTSMNMQTGVFSGHSEVDGIDFALNGVEKGTELNYTQSENGYVAHDHVPRLRVLANGHVGGDGSFEDGEFWMETGSGAGAKASKGRAYVTVLCNIFPAAPSTSTCTADVGSLEGTGPVPTGTVHFTTTTGTLQGDECSLQLAVGLGFVSSCTVGYTPAPETPEGVPLPVVGRYSGDSRYGPAEGTTSPGLPVPASSTEVTSNGSFTLPITNTGDETITGGVSVAVGGQSAVDASIHVTRFHVRAFRVVRLHLRLTRSARRKLHREHTLVVTVREKGSVAGKHLTRSFKVRLRRHR